MKGKQFRYILPLNNNAGKLLKESTVTWNREYPKEDCLKWKVRTGYKKYEELQGLPSFDLSVVNVNTSNVEAMR